MSRYQAYPEYKDSESKWLDQLPMGWQRAPLKHLVAIKITDGPHETPEFVDDGIPFLSAEAVKNNKLDFTKKRGFITRELHEIYSKKCLPKIDDVFMIKSGNTTGNIAIVETTEEFNIWSPLALIRTDKHKILPRFIFYVMQADFFRTSVELSWSQGTQPNIGMAVIENLHIPVASLLEQRLIANFLDHETAKIDALIGQQQQLIQLLKEKRQAVISRAVTKGLNSNAPMKDSGVNWLGEVPEHWSVSRIKNIVSIPVTDGPHETPKFIDEGVPFVSAEAVSSGELDFNKIRGFISEEANSTYSKKYSPKKHDIYMVKSGATTGVTAIVETDDIFNIWSPLAVIRCGNNFEPYFVLNFMRSEPFQEAIKLNWSFGTQQNIGMGVIENLHITCPPKSEAEEIAKYLQNEDQKFKSVVSSAYDAIQLMQERRTALISAAVTGKIDVRSWQAPTHQ